MSDQVARLDKPFGAYAQAGAHWRPDKELTSVGPRTPGGEYLRRFWHPIGFSDALEDLPVRMRVLGEDLVLFKDGSSRIGLLTQNCIHRGTSLEFGLVQERGIRCCYHGWHYDTDGTILDTPGEPATSRIREQLFQGAYPTHEYHGLVFAYLGPAECLPPFPMYDAFDPPGIELRPWGGNVVPCNWVQIKENCMDPAHTAFLHTIGEGIGFTDSFGVLPELQFQEVPNGEVYIAARRVGDNVWVRMTNWILPNLHQYAPTWEDGRNARVSIRVVRSHWSVPVDDTNTLNIGFNHYHPDDPDREMLETAADFGQACDRPYEERQRLPGDYDAHTSIGPIALHARENLGATDVGVAMFRQILRRNIQRIAEGQDPPPFVLDKQRVRTYTNDTAVRLPQSGDEEADKNHMREMALKVAAAIISRDLQGLEDLSGSHI